MITRPFAVPGRPSMALSAKLYALRYTLTRLLFHRHAQNTTLADYGHCCRCSPATLASRSRVPTELHYSPVHGSGELQCRPIDPHLLPPSPTHQPPQNPLPSSSIYTPHSPPPTASFPMASATATLSTVMKRCTAVPGASRCLLLPLLLLLLLACGGATAQVFPPWNGTFPMGPGGGNSGSGGAAASVPAMFVFGDSLTDNGNNNDLTSLAKANYLPYGIDFAGGPTGRFSNGYTMVDEIAVLLGLPLLPSHNEASSGDAALHGVNYASAAAGILDNTGQNFVGRIPFNEQIKNFEATLNQITGKLGAGKLAGSLARSIFYVGMGSNDYLNNYLMPNYNTRNEYNGEQYSTLLVQQYTKQLKSLYNLGARKFVIAGVGSMACIPNMRARNPANQCSPDVDDLIIPFNSKVKSMVNTLNVNLPRAKFIYVDTYGMIAEVLRNPWSYGFSVVDRGCCGIGRNRGMITCLPFQRPCPNRNTYVFWDAFHPTERVNVLLGKAAFSAGTDLVYPMNIQQLAARQP